MVRAFLEDGAPLAVATRRTGIPQRVTVHSLRHSFATSLLMAGTPIQDVQRLLGHAHLETTQIYAHCLPHTELRVRSPLDAPAANVLPFPALTPDHLSPGIG
jgi:integrase